jgi:dethiobiotin synthetase
MIRNSYFVTGTDTNIGKTVISTVLSLGLNAKYWKPIQTGAFEETDRNFVKRWLGDGALRESYLFSLPASPHIAASQAGEKINFKRICNEFLTISGDVIVEGAGGLLVPIDASRTIADLISAFSLPAIVVTSTRLGTINHTLLTLEALSLRSIQVAGFITAGKESYEIVNTIERFGGSSCLGHIPHCESFSLDWFEQVFRSLSLPQLTKENQKNAL